MEIVTPTSDFDFKTITLADPQPLAGHAGYYFTQLYANTNANGVAQEEEKALCLQLPECITKQGIVDIKNAKYMDLMFERDKREDLMHWIETLEYTCQDIINSKKDLWFQTELTRDDIETMMTQVIRLYQSGKYMLMRVFIDINKTGQKCIAYNENEIGFDLDTLEANKKIIPLVMIEGVKFSSRSFEISLKLVQVMVMGGGDKKSSCLIRRPIDKPLELLAKPLQIQPVKQPLQTQPARQAPQPAQPTKHLEPARHVPQPTQPAQPTQPTQPTKHLEPARYVPQPAKQPQHVQLPPNGTKSLVVKKLIEPVRNNVVIGAIGIKPIIKKKKDIEEITLNYEDVTDSISLKNPNEVYYEMYKNARNKAKQCRLNAIESYLEAKQIKTKYMLQDLDEDESDGSDDEFYNVETD